MAWKVSFDPDKFEEALGWFTARVPMPARRYYALEAYARDKAFTVSHVAQMDAVQTVLEKLNKAIADGWDLSQFAKETTDALVAAFQGQVANPAWRIETIFRTNCSTAFARGRTLQMDDPVVSSIRPYRMIDGPDDARSAECDICPPVRGVVVRFDDPWIAEHTPPLHHCCRDHLRALREDQAKRQKKWGEPKPNVKADEGFGIKPTLANTMTTRLKPDYAKYDPELAAKAKRKDEQKRPKPPAQVTPEKSYQQFEATLNDVANGLEKGDAEAAAKARGAAREHLANVLGIRSSDVAEGRSGAQSVQLLEGFSSSYHHWDGTIAIPRARIQSFKTKVYQGQWSHRDALRTQLHEELHGCGGLTPKSYDADYSLTGKEGEHWLRIRKGSLIEECSVELLANKAVRDADPTYPVTRRGYKPIISALEGIVGKHSSSSRKTRELLEEAAIKYKQSMKRLDSPDEAVDLFVSGLDLPESERRKIRAELDDFELTLQ